MSQKNAVLSVQLTKKNGKLVHKSLSGKQQYQDLMDFLEEGQTINVFFDAAKGDGSYGQISKIHVCIRELATEVGCSFDDMKLRVKEHAGLIIQHKDGATIKSFADCSGQELSLVIESTLELGDLVGINFRQVYPKNQVQ